MAGPPDYRAISRRPPFTGLSSANATAGEYTGATEAVNVRLYDTANEKAAKIQRRGGLRRRYAFSTSYTDMLGYREPATLRPGLDTTLSRRSTAAGATLFGPGGISVLVPVVFTLSNLNRHHVQIALSETGSVFLTVDNVNLGEISGTLSSLTAALSAYSILPVDFSVTGFTARYWKSDTDAATAIPISTVEPLASDASYLMLECAGILPTVMPTAQFLGSDFVTPPPVYKARIGENSCSFGLPPNSSVTKSAYFTDGLISDVSTLRADISSITGTAGAGYFEYAVQVKYFLGSNGAATLPYLPYLPSDAVITGPLSTRVAATLLSSANPRNVSVLGTGFGKLATDFYAVPASGTGQQVTVRYGFPGLPEAYGGGRCGRIIVTSSSAETEFSRGGGTSSYGEFLTGTVSASQRIGLSAKLVVWRTKEQTSAAAATAAVLYKVGEGIIDTATGAYIDSSVDASLTEVYLPRAIEPEVTSNESRPTSAAYHQTRHVIGTESGQLLLSLSDEPLNFAPSTLAIQMPASVRALVSMLSVLYVFCDDGIYVIDGALGTLDSSVQKISSLTLPTGYGQQGAVSSSENQVVFVGSDYQVYLIKDQQVAAIPNLQLPIPEPMYGPEWGSATALNTAPSFPYSRIRVAYSSDDQVFAIGYVGSQTLYVLDQKYRWSTYTLPYCLNDIAALNGELSVLLAESSGTSLWSFTKSFQTDGGQDFTCRYASQWEDLEDPRTEKTFAKLHIDLAEGASQNADLTVKTEFDYLAGKPGTSKVCALRDSQGWGNRPWGAFGWGDKNQTHVSLPLTNEKHRSMRVIFESTQNLAISGWTIEAQVAGAHSKNGEVP